MDPPLSEYIQLMQSFADGKTAASDFMHRYFELTRNQTATSEDERLYEILQQVWYACEDFCDDPNLFDRSEGDIDANDLLAAVRKALTALDDLAN